MILLYCDLISEIFFTFIQREITWKFHADVELFLFETRGEKKFETE